MSNDHITIHPSSSLAITLIREPSTQLAGPGSMSSPPSILPKPPLWWKSLTSIYQIYPASFFASAPTPQLPPNSHASPFSSHLPPPPTSGLGDLKGITSKLPYLSSLGIDCIWISPCYPSPMVDMGYDISDYTAIDTRYGSLADMDVLITKAHGMNIRVLMDLVINHTSDQHRWFKESCKSKNGKHADFYIWKDAKISKDKDGKETRDPPNNWGSFFGGSAWKWVEERGQYYLHLFDYRQPDLNWENPEMRKAVYDDAIRFWLERGIDGFRVDTCGIYSKDSAFPDGNVENHGKWKGYGDPMPFVVNGPKIHQYWQEIRRDALDQYGDILMVGELGPIGHEKLMDFVGRERRELSMVFDFEMAAVGKLENTGAFEDLVTWTLPELKEAVKRNQELSMDVGGKMGDGWGSVSAENHDLPRSVSRFGSGSVTFEGSGRLTADYQIRSAKLLAILLGTSSGTLYLYQGQEIGMTNIPESWSLDDLRDLASIEYYQKAEKDNPDDKELLKRIWKGIVAFSRDNARTPMQWNDHKHAGFTEETPWMTVNDNYKQINVEKQAGKSGSVLEFWKSILRMRRQNAELFINAKFHLHDLKDDKVFTFEKRTDGEEAALVILNFSEEMIDLTLPVPDIAGRKWRLHLSNMEGKSEKLRPWEGRVYIAF